LNPTGRGWVKILEGQLTETEYAPASDGDEEPEPIRSSKLSCGDVVFISQRTECFMQNSGPDACYSLNLYAART
jgi:hypothetical protein